MASKITDLLKIKKNIAFYKAFSEGKNYLFTGKDTVWSDNEDDPNYQINSPDVDNLNLALELNDIIGLKRITTNDVSLGIKRYDWGYGKIYDAYNCYDENLLRKQFFPGTNPFYVMTNEYNIYKCLSNNNGGYSTIKPVGQFYTPIQLDDGYIWKFMFSIPEDQRLKFLTTSYIPIKANDELIASSTQELIAFAAIPGTIDTVTMISTGEGYDELTTAVGANDADPSDYAYTGTGFYATAVVSNGAITAINVTAPGHDYTGEASIIIQGDGSSATAKPQLSPPDGHGANAAFELGAFYTLVSLTLNDDDVMFFPYTKTYRKVGIITDHKEYLLNTQYTQDYYYGPRHPDFLDADLRTANPERFMKDYVGNLLYINYMAKVTRTLNQQEVIKFAIETI